MIKVAVLNDTRTQFHHGCELVMKQLKGLLEERGIHIYVYSEEGTDWSANETFKRKLKECQAVVVNGEGTIHHDRPAGKKLLEIASFAESYGIPSFLINSTYQDNPISYTQYLSKFRRIYVRESLSHKELQNIGVPSEIAPDLTLSYSFKNSLIRESVAVTDSAITPTSERLLEYANINNYLFLPVLRSYRNEGEINIRELARDFKFEINRLAISFSKNGNYLRERNLFITKKIQSYLKKISQCKLVITARFHVVCFCLITETPFLAIPGNSHKIEGLLSDVGLSGDRIISINDLENIQGPDLYEYTISELESLRAFKARARESIIKMIDAIENLT